MKLLYIILPVLALCSCIKEDLEPCPQSDVRVRLYVEKFQAGANDGSEGLEPRFNARIQSLRGYLSKEDAPWQTVDRTDCVSCTDSAYVFRFGALPFGRYTLTVVGNFDDGALVNEGGRVAVVYPGEGKSKDYFAVTLPFTVDCNCEIVEEAVLRRLHGVIRYTFEQLPSGVSTLEMRMTKLCNRQHSDGRYDGDTEVVKRIDLDNPVPGNRAQVVVGTFPTAEGQRSAYYLKLYKNGEEKPFYGRLVTDTLQVVRNRLLDIVTRFNGDEPMFEVTVDKQWDGFVPGGDVEVN